ncbi:MAG: poly(hydroxyalkanoate) granule-associated protein, partial [Variovorax sp.]
TEDDPNAGNADRVKDSAQQIWLAGLGAFAKMQQEGSKAFEALVKDGAGMQKKTQQAAEETLSQAQTRMAGLASEFGAKTSAGWGKLENLFEERVARALEHLGVPSAEDVTALRARVAALEAQVKVRQASTPRTTAKRADPAAKAAKRPRSRNQR